MGLSRISGVVAGCLVAGALALLPGTAAASDPDDDDGRSPKINPPEFSAHFLKCLGIQDRALDAVHDMQAANQAMESAAGAGDAKAFNQASNDYDAAARDYNRAVNRYTENGCLGIDGPGPLPAAPEKWSP